jgi:hypothetical protein
MSWSKVLYSHIATAINILGRLSPERKTHYQTGHFLIERQRHSSVLDVQSFRAAEYETGNYLVVAKIRERLAVNKQSSRTFHMERFSLKKLNKVEGNEKYHVEVSSRLKLIVLEK